MQFIEKTVVRSDYDNLLLFKTDTCHLKIELVIEISVRKIISLISSFPL